MLHNAKLVEVNPPAGDALEMRCTLASPTTSEQAWLESAGVAASAVVYLPLTGSPLPGISVGDVLVIQLDGQSQASWVAAHVSDRVGGVLRYRQVFVVEQA
ncbi:hypothetical protein [Humisphaera borealis]|uniref:Uncharacterized protein n=1 Tax=Humisphaera borealis TaxID=2807512 RepID=A0A7M2WPL1_9BACT|nr:hypothetical protein [Humisphaera borealis]QOV87408.1 hypothetical protein IPV69_14020 [Humisphaera borealis]